MKKELWVYAAQDNLDWKKRKKFITESLESGVDAVVVKEGETKKAKDLGNIRVVGDKEADLKLIKVEKDRDIESLDKNKVAFVEINSKEDETRAQKCAKHVNYVVVSGREWKIIPYENLIANIKDAKLIATAKDEKEAKVNLETLERGTDGILLNSKAEEIKKVSKLLQDKNQIKFDLIDAKITKIKEVGMGDRVCIDTCSMLKIGEGMLVGSQSNGLFLIHSETIESPYVATRPFRVNAGAVPSYTLIKGAKTQYLSEIEAGDEVLAVDNKGMARIVIVGRSKIESRPLMLIEATYNKKIYKVLLQNAETIRLVDQSGKAISVAKVKVGDKIKCYIESGGRHFGTKVDETITEK